MQSKRNLGIDLLRIAATFMVCALHTLSQGGILMNVDTLSPQGWAAWLITAFFSCAVNSYGLISGYVGWNTKTRYSRLASLWVSAVYIGLVITLGFAVWKPEAVTFTHWIKVFLPFSTRQFWYVSAYAGVVLLMPMMNLALQRFSQKQMKATLIFISVGALLYSLLYNPWISDEVMGGAAEPYGLSNGYSTIWLLALYLLGAYFGKYGLPDWLRGGKALLGYALCALCAWGITMGCFALNGLGSGAYLYGVAYCSPFTVGEAICLLAFFRNVKPGERSAKLISFIAPSTVCIFMFHYQPLIWNYVLKNLIVDYVSQPVFALVAAIFLCSAAIFIVCFALDLVRRWIFGKLKVNKILNSLEDKLIGNLWEDVG